MQLKKLTIINDLNLCKAGILSSGANGLMEHHAGTGSLGAVSPVSSSSGRLSSPDIIFSNLVKNIFDNLHAVLVIKHPPTNQVNRRSETQARQYNS